ncbi:hypothetical protein ACFOWE_14840 [Planomonospora corallina]|uniref:Uncharacterized protein n=1 Tax=Planomonospora corallina TaxID=1806052 RepID=A0ABV8IAQ1_9ACTN
MCAPALAEARLSLFHPLALAGFLVTVAGLPDEPWEGPRVAFRALTLYPVLPWAVSVFFAANLRATAPRRAGVEELLSTAPAGRARRTALCGLGAALLGTATARWTPWRGAGPGSAPAPC